MADETDSVLMNVKSNMSPVAEAYLFSAKYTIRLMVYLARLAKKGLIAAKGKFMGAENFKEFVAKTDGRYKVYNVPLSKQASDAVLALQELERQLEATGSRHQRVSLQRQINSIVNDLPEIQQLTSLGITFNVLPKLNGSEQTIQVAVADSDAPEFKNWFSNHVMQHMSGGSQDMDDLSVFTEGQYQIFNMPFEGPKPGEDEAAYSEKMKSALSDFDTLKINYTLMPDLNPSDNHTQFAVANADVDRLRRWAQLYKQAEDARKAKEDAEAKAGSKQTENSKQTESGKQTEGSKQTESKGSKGNEASAQDNEVRSMSMEEYLLTSIIDDADVITNSQPQYRQADQEFENSAGPNPMSEYLDQPGSEQSEAFARLSNDERYEKLSINKDTLVDRMKRNAGTDELERNGYFVSRIPGTYGSAQKALVVPNSQVFLTDGGQTYVAFLEKNKDVSVLSMDGNVESVAFKKAVRPYSSVDRNFGKVESIIREEKVKEAAVNTETQQPSRKMTQQPKVQRQVHAKNSAPKV